MRKLTNVDIKTEMGGTIISSVKITFSDGLSYTLKSPEELENIDRDRNALFLFNNGEIYSGFTDGEVDEDGDFCLSRPDTKFSIGLPFSRLLGWEYKKEG